MVHPMLRNKRKVLGSSMRDRDKDGAIDIADCRPNDPRRQGVITGIARVGAKSIKKSGMGIARTIAANQAIREKARVAFLQEKEKQKVSLARQKARIRAQEELKRFKGKFKKRKFVRPKNTGVGNLFKVNI